ncbi:unknown [Prevotella sp. CAG:5226]|nr:unknown [Prevotella sp. CAG:5226]
MAMATRKQAVNATPAVMNQPPITVSTPVMRNTAVSRPQARSANDEPMATMKVTNVVERGNLSEVPSAMSNDDTTRLTEARHMSYAA